MTSSHGPNALARADKKVKEILARSKDLTAGAVSLVDAPAGASEIPATVEVRAATGRGINRGGRQARDACRGGYQRPVHQRPH